MMYHLKSLIATHRAKLVVATLTYMLYNAIDPMGSEHAGFAISAFVMMVVVVISPAMLFAAHLDSTKPGRVAAPVRRFVAVSNDVADEDDNSITDDANTFSERVTSQMLNQELTGNYMAIGSKF